MTRILGGCLCLLLTGSAFGQAAPALVLSGNAISFSAFDGGDAPTPQSFGLVSSSSTQPVSYSLRVDGGSWLSAAPASGTTPARIQVSASQAGLAAGSFSANIVVSAPGSPDQIVAVTFSISSSPVILEVSPSFLRFEAANGSTTPLGDGFFVRNAGGGGPLNFQASVSSDSDWLTLTQDSAQTTPNIPTAVRLTVNPGGLAVGVYRAVVHVDSDAGPADVAVSLAIGAPGPVLGLNFTGLLFESRQGNGNSNTRNVLVLNNGSGAVNWETELLSGQEWLSLSNASARGQATPENASRLALTANPGSLDPGVYYALIRISDPAALDSPQYFTAVLHVNGADQPASPDPTPQGLFFVSNSGGPPPATQPVRLFVSSNTPVRFQASVSTADGASWLSIDQTSGMTSTQQTANLSVTADASKLPPGIYTGDVTVAFPNADIRTTNITMVVPNQGAAAGLSAKSKAAAGCAASKLSLTQTGLVNSFSAPAGWPETLIVRLADDCGLPVLNAQMVAEFSNGDPALSMKLTNPQVGLYSATWSPTATGGQVHVTARATAPGLAAATAEITGAVLPNQAPVLFPNGTFSNANPIPGGPVAPGSIAQVTGVGLASSAMEAEDSPLPAVLNQTGVLIGASAAPLFAVSPDRLKIQIPADLDPNRQHTIVVSVNGAYTVPDVISVAPAAPAILTDSDGLAASPAHAGDVITIFLEGMGATNPPFASGTAAGPNAAVELQPAVTIGGETAAVSHAGLVPDMIGIYEITLQIPRDLAPGDLTLVVTQNGVASNSGIVPVR